MIGEYLLKIRDEWQLPMLLVSHRAEDVAQLSDRTVTMENGVVGKAANLAEEGDPDDDRSGFRRRRRTRRLPCRFADRRTPT